MSRRDEIKRELEQLDYQRTRLNEQLEQAEREELYKAYLRRLLEADIRQPSCNDVESAFQQEVLRWLMPETSQARKTIRDWVIATIGARPGELTPAQLRDLFRSEFGPRRVPSLRQYLTKTFGLVQKRDGKLLLTQNGQREFRRLGKASSD